MLPLCALDDLYFPFSLSKLDHVINSVQIFGCTISSAIQITVQNVFSLGSYSFKNHLVFALTVLNSSMFLHIFIIFKSQTVHTHRGQFFICCILIWLYVIATEGFWKKTCPVLGLSFWGESLIYYIYIYTKFETEMCRVVALTRKKDRESDN